MHLGSNRLPWHEEHEETWVSLPSGPKKAIGSHIGASVQRNVAEIFSQIRLVGTDQLASKI